MNEHNPYCLKCKTNVSLVKLEETNCPNCRENLAVRTTRETYFIKRFIDRGSSGDVYKAYTIDSKEKKCYAIKFYTFTHNLEECKNELNKEIENLENAKNAGARVPKFIEYYFSDNIRNDQLQSVFFIQEFIGGKNLSGFIQDKFREITDNKDPFSQEKIFKYLIKLLQTISLIHDQEIIHRDIKPSNIVIKTDIDTNTEELYLVDFGSSKKLSPGKNKFTEKQPKTKIYSPPELNDVNDDEQLNNHKWTRDLYSLAVTIHEMATGNDNHSVQQSPTPNNQNSWMSEISDKFPNLYRYLEKMSRYFPSERYQTAMEALLDVSSEAYSMYRDNDYLLNGWLLRLALKQPKGNNDKWNIFLDDSEGHEKRQIRENIRKIVEIKKVMAVLQ
jgi:eukaryotic-like serine/threonine-protein kinase